MYFTPHITVATIVEQQGKFLLVEEKVGDQIVLNQPAGHVEIGEHALEAACRETMEETGWQVELTHLVGVYFYTAPHNQVTYLRLCFAAKPLAKNENAVLDKEIIQPLWLTVDELLQRQTQLRSPLVLKCIEDYMDGQCYPLTAVYDHRFA